MTLRQHLRASLTNGLLVFAFIAVGALLGSLIGAAVVPALRVEHTPDRYEQITQMIAEHDCWVYTGPEGVEPSHAVVSHHGGDPEYVPAEVGYGIWLDGEPGTVHAFCP